MHQKSIYTRSEMDVLGSVSTIVVKHDDREPDRLHCLQLPLAVC